MKLPTHPSMTPEAFAAALASLGLNATGFAEVMISLGDTRPPLTVVRRAQALAAGEVSVPPGVACLLTLMARCPEAWRTRESVAGDRAL